MEKKILNYMDDELISNIGEKELINRLSKFMPQNQTSDDCASLNFKGTNLLINTDVMVEDRHFKNKILSAEELGWKSIASNVSDLISSGCDKILGISIGLVIPENTSWLWVENLYRGINNALNIYGGSIIGGDCSSGSKKLISITAIGEQSNLISRRFFCKPGHKILTTGPHGLSKVGLLLKTNAFFNQSKFLSAKLIDESIKAFCKPSPQKELIGGIFRLKPKSCEPHIGCTDTSDGLFQSLLDLSNESKCKAIVDYSKIPKHIDWPNGKIWDEYYFYGGEDYELVFSVPQEWADKIINNYMDITEIGYFTEGNSSVEIINCEKDFLLEAQSFSHF